MKPQQLQCLKSSQAPWLPKSFAKFHKIVPTEVSDQEATIASVQPISLSLEDALSFSSFRKINTVLVPEDEFQQRFKYFCQDEKPFLAAAEPQTQFQDDSATFDQSTFNSILKNAITQGASDIHLEPLKDNFRIRVRVDGKLKTFEILPIKLHPFYVNHIKARSKLSLYEKRLPQDGRFTWEVDAQHHCFRVSILPSTCGESIVIRLFNNLATHNVQTLGLPQPLISLLEDTLKNHKGGLFICCGPTGSGKTTTLYALMQYFLSQSRRITTIEDPVEQLIPGANQLNIADEVGVTFKSAFKSLLRQSPEIIVVGEIRDPESAQIVVEAAQTGHLVMTSIHAASADEVAGRFVDLGVTPGAYQASLLNVLTHNLVQNAEGSGRVGQFELF